MRRATLRPVRASGGIFRGSVGADCRRTRPNVPVGALLLKRAPKPSQGGRHRRYPMRPPSGSRERNSAFWGMRKKAYDGIRTALTVSISVTDNPKAAEIRYSI
jgi:hypothetical protein